MHPQQNVLNSHTVSYASISGGSVHVRGVSVQTCIKYGIYFRQELVITQSYDFKWKFVLYHFRQVAYFPQNTKCCMYKDLFRLLMKDKLSHDFNCEYS